jgi:hypothetical protein
MKAIIIFTLYIMIFVLFSPVVSGQDKKYLPNETGKWESVLDVDSEILNEWKMNENEEIQYRKNLDRMSIFMHDNNVLKNPLGVSVLTKGYLFSKSETEHHFNPILSVLQLDLFSFVDFGKGKSEIDKYSPVSLFLYANCPDKCFMDCNYYFEGLVDDNNNPIYLEPEKISEVNGFPIYSNILIISKKNKPVWIPVTKGEYLNALIKRSKKMTKKDQPINNPVLDELENEYKSLSSDEKQNPAIVAQNEKNLSRLVKDKQIGRALVKFNPEYFDQSKSRTALQLIVTHWVWGIPYTYNHPLEINNDTPTNQVRLYELFKSLDYQKLIELLE